MPPPACVGATAGAVGSFPATGNAAANLFTPSTVAAGDHLIAMVVATAIGGDVDAASLPAGWAVIARKVTTAARVVNVLRRVVAVDEPGTHAIPLASSAPTFASWLLAYRGLLTGAAITAFDAADVSGTTLAAPTVSATLFSDLMIGAAVALTGSPTLSAASVSERQRVAGTSGGLPFVAWDLLPEVTGPIALVSASSASTSGVGVSLVLAAQPPMLAPSIVPDIPGAIGLVMVGV